MTNTSTQDTQACVEQAKRIVDAGGEYVRLTTQGIKEAFEQQREHDETGWGLVMTVPKEVSDETSAMKHEKFKSAAQEQMSARAFWQGNEEGKKFDPGTKIAGKAEQKMALGGI